MGFRFRLASFFVAALVIVQVLTAVLVYQVSRRELIAEGGRQLGVSATAFGRQLEETSERVADSVQVLALDFALRTAIAQRDEETLRSALRNHAQRVGAERLMVVDTAGEITGDTLGPARGRFPYADLVERGLVAPTAAVVQWQGRAHWMVVVPVRAPDVIGLIAAAIPIDTPLLSRLQAQSVLPKSIELATPTGTGWQVLARGDDTVPLAAALGGTGSTLPTAPRLVRLDGREYLAQGVWLARSDHSAPVAAVLGYSVDDALHPYRTVGAAWAGLLAFGLVVGLAGAFLIARQVSRPVEALAGVARRIEAGDYDAAPPPAPRRDELGELATAIAAMTRAIREREAHIRFQAGHDQVTGLNNRIAAEAAIHAELLANPGRPAALLVVGLRRLPDIVKTMGHALADRVMAEAAARLRRLVPDAHVARATDTEFSIFLPGAEQAVAIATGFRLVDALAEPYREADLTLDLEPAAGLALHPRHGHAPSALLSHATVALLSALDAEEAIVVYDPAIDPHRPDRLSLMGELREAIDHDRLALHYQPKLNLRTGRIDGAEGLVRWTHPQRGPIPPDAFIALAEETGNIRRLTRWALGAGIRQARRWQDAGLDLRIAINVSARDLVDADLPRRVSELLALHAVAPERIVLEVTESAVMGKPSAAIATLQRLADDGIDLAIDDFGVGQSSFAYLRQLPVRELKIDRMFIARLADTPIDRTIVRSIVDLGHQLGYRVTAEGVDSDESLRFLAGIGCDHAQGYFVARPMEAEAVRECVVEREEREREREQK
jgi:diguanylate cyclase (GGDEF)-like protein